jgi:hypothetical protein
VGFIKDASEHIYDAINVFDWWNDSIVVESLKKMKQKYCLKNNEEFYIINPFFDIMYSKWVKKELEKDWKNLENFNYYHKEMDLYIRNNQDTIIETNNIHIMKLHSSFFPYPTILCENPEPVPADYMIVFLKNYFSDIKVNIYKNKSYFCSLKCAKNKVQITEEPQLLKCDTCGYLLNCYEFGRLKCKRLYYQIIKKQKYSIEDEIKIINELVLNTKISLEKIRKKFPNSWCYTNLAIKDNEILNNLLNITGWEFIQIFQYLVYGSETGGFSEKMPFVFNLGKKIDIVKNLIEKGIFFFNDEFLKNCYLNLNENMPQISIMKNCFI